MKIRILIGLLLVSFSTQPSFAAFETFASSQDVVGESLYNQVQGMIKKLSRILKKENLFKRAGFNRLKRSIKGNNIDLALQILDKYESKGSTKVKNVVKGLRRRLKALVASQIPVPEEEEVCESGFVQTEFFSTERAFAALKTNGLVITWGADDYGGDSSEVADEISCGVVNIVANKSAFAALKSDGSVVTWGESGAGGDSSSVSSQLNNVNKIYATQRAFAAVRNDHSVVLWGDRYHGGEAAIMRESYSALGEWKAFPLHPSLLDGSQNNVIKIVATKAAFAAILENKQDPTQVSVATWGDELYGGDLSIHSLAGGGGSRIDYEFPDSSSTHSFFMKDISPLVQSGVVDIFSNTVAFAAIKDNGSVVTWGVDDFGGDSSYEFQNLQSNVKKIFSSRKSFAALKSDGSVVSWGEFGREGGYIEVAGDLQSGVIDIVSNDYAFVAIKDDGTMASWGNSPTTTGLFGFLTEEERGEVRRVVATKGAFAALKRDESVISWGNEVIRPLEQEALDATVISIVANDDAFAALRRDGSVITWGWEDSGGNLPFSRYEDYMEAIHVYYEDPAYALRHIYRIEEGAVKVATTKAAFVALMGDGSIVTWGADGYGADSSSVASLFGQ